jgi:hypothetical protein
LRTLFASLASACRLAHGWLSLWFLLVYRLSLVYRIFHMSVLLKRLEIFLGRSLSKKCLLSWHAFLLF